MSEQLITLPHDDDADLDGIDLGSLDPSDFDDFDVLTDDLSAEEAFESFMLDPEQTAIAREAEGMPPVNEDQYRQWLASLPEDRRQFLEGERDRYLAERDRRNSIHEKLTTLVPELYEAKLPPELEQKLGDARYAVGFNQTMSARDVASATAYLRENQGVGITRYRLTHRFLMYDDSMGKTQLGMSEPKVSLGLLRAGTLTIRPWVDLLRRFRCRMRRRSRKEGWRPRSMFVLKKCCRRTPA
jgi:hypothetical protein